MNRAPVLVTGANGYIGSFVTKLLLEKGFKVRGSVYSLARKSDYQFLYDLFPQSKSNLELVEADLTSKDAWPSVTKGVDSIFHVASPTPGSAPPEDEYFTKPAVAGVLNVLEAALKNDVRKVVVTSSVAAVAFRPKDKVCTEEDWEAEEGLVPYPKSKVRAEKAAWEFYEKNKGKMELAVVNPSFVFGPVLTSKGNTSSFVGTVMSGVLPGVFDSMMPIVDVRDVAEVHYRAMFNEKANGKRYLCVAESVPLGDVAHWLNKEFGKKGIKVPEGKVSLEEAKRHWNPEVKVFVETFGKRLVYDNQRSVKDLGMEYIPVEKTIIETGNSLLEHGMVKIE